MSEAEVKSLIATIRGSSQVMLFLLLTHCIPLSRPLLVRPHVEKLCCDHDNNVVASDSKKHSVAAVVVRSIIRSI